MPELVRPLISAAPAPGGQPVRTLLLTDAPTREYQFLRTFLSREQARKKADLTVYFQPPAGKAPREGVVADVPADKLLEQALTYAKAIAEGGPDVLAHTKDLLRRFTHQTTSIEEAAKASAAPRLTRECREGLEAFFAKRPAPWVPGA